MDGGEEAKPEGEGDGRAESAPLVAGENVCEEMRVEAEQPRQNRPQCLFCEDDGPGEEEQEACAKAEGSHRGEERYACFYIQWQEDKQCRKGL